MDVENNLKSCADFIKYLSFDENEEEKDDYTYIKDNIFKYEDENHEVYALKVFLVKNSITDFDYYKNLFTTFINQVINMATIRHTAIVELQNWNLFSRITKKWLIKHIKEGQKSEEINNLPEEEANEDNVPFHPFLTTPFYETSMEDIITKKMFTKWNITQFSIFIYGLIRAFSHLNSFNLIHKEIHPEKILFEKKDNYFYPKYNDFNYYEDGQVSEQLNRFGEILSELSDEMEVLKSENPFESFITALKVGNDLITNFHSASMEFELRIIPKLKLEEPEKDIFDEYKKRIDNFESTNFASKKNRDSAVQLKESLKGCQGNIYKAVRKMISLNENSQASLKLALYYYSGRILPKDLVSCIQYLKFSIIQSNDTAPKIFLRSLEAIKDRKLPNAESEDDSDEISLYYKGVFAESLAIDCQISKQEPTQDDDLLHLSMRGSSMALEATSWEEEIKKAIHFYTQSLKVKSTPIVMGRLGAVLTKYVDNSDDAAGPRLLKLACDAGDIYGMVNYGLYLIHAQKNTEAIKIFKRLYKRNYIDAAFTLGNLYYQEENFDKAKEYFTKAYDVFGCDEAKQYIDEIDKKK